MKLACILFSFIFLKVSFAFPQYYISSEGDDSFAGTSPDKPWKTIDRLESGKTYSLKRGDVFHFSIGEVPNTDKGKKITINSYGQGEKPTLSYYLTISKEYWEKSTSNIWKTDLSKNPLSAEFKNSDMDIGFLKIKGSILGSKKPSVKKLTNDWDFYSEGDYLFVYASDKGLLSQEIQASPHLTAIQLSDNMEISDLQVEGAGGHAIQGVDKNNVMIRNVDIKEIGGSYLPGFGEGQTRYGNGIEFWNGCTNCQVRDCKIEQVYDAGITLQGIGKGVYYEKVLIRNNKLNHNGFSFEVWVSEYGKGFKKCRITKNISTHAGMGWSRSYRPEKDLGVHILFYEWDFERKNNDLKFKSNIFFKAATGLYSWHHPSERPPYKSQKNRICLGENTGLLAGSDVYTVRNYKSFIREFGIEHGSRFFLIQD